MKIPAAWQCKLGTLLLLLGATFSAAQAQKFAFRTVSPPTSTYSFAAGINQKGNVIVGAFQDAGSQFKGFVYNGRRYQTIHVPGPGQTQATGVNDSNTVVGFFDGNEGFTHGYLLNGRKLIQYDVNKGVVSTYIYGINNAGNFTGYVSLNSATQGFVNIGGAVTQFTVNGNPTTAFAIDSANNTVGSWVDPNLINTHGFYRAADGTLTQIDYPGSGITACLGINDLGEITGFYVDNLGAGHGFVTKNGKFRDASPLLDIWGVNNHRSFVGYYISHGVTYGYAATPR